MLNAHYDKCSLYLIPESPNFTVTNINPFIRSLQNIQLISQQIKAAQQEDEYYIGDKFLDYIAYLGCAPNIRFQPSTDNKTDNNNFCFVKIHHYSSAQLIHDQLQSRPPHCPKCRKAVKNWRQNQTEANIKCEHCNTISDIKDFNWRKMAGLGHIFIEISDIFPKEAIPQQLLLNKLADISNTQWQYFYSCR